MGALACAGTDSGTAGVGFREKGKEYQLFRSTQGEVELPMQRGRLLAENIYWKTGGRHGFDEAVRFHV